MNTYRRVLWSMALAVPALLWSGAAWSWNRLGQTEDVVLYLQRHSIEKEGTIHRVWEMQDLRKADADGVMSRRYLNEYDCQYKMHRIGQVTSFSGPKLSGRKLFEVEEFGYWRKIPPDGLFAVVYVWLCVR